MARVGATVVPAWEKSFGARYPDERQMRFYAASLHTANCSALPNGIVLIPEKTANRLSTDAELAAFLAGCVAEIEEEQIAVVGGDVPGSDRDVALSSAAFAAFGLTGAAINGAYQKHLQDLFEQQSARVALTYLAAAGYPLSAGPQVWELLESKHGQPDLSRPPGTRTQFMYQALSEENTQAEAAAASMLK